MKENLEMHFLPFFLCISEGEEDEEAKKKLL